MFKKFIANLIIITMLLSIATVAYAAPNNKLAARDNMPVFQLVNDVDGNKTFESELIVSGRARVGTVMSVNHYWYKTGEDESILKMDQESSDEETGEWVELDSPESWTVGASGIFANSVELKEGQNKIELVGKDKSGEVKKETIVVELVDKDKLTEYISNFILKDINKNINQK